MKSFILKESQKQVAEARQALAPRLIRANAAYIFLGSRQIVLNCEAAGWLKPVVRRHKMTLYSVADLHRCANRLEAGEYPGEQR